MIENERDCFTKICEALLRCGPLTVRAWYFGTVGDMPWAVLLDNGGEFVVDACILALACVIQHWHWSASDERGDRKPKGYAGKGVKNIWLIDPRLRLLYPVLSADARRNPGRVHFDAGWLG